jgi:hypothetical protein
MTELFFHTPDIGCPVSNQTPHKGTGLKWNNFNQNVLDTFNPTPDDGLQFFFRRAIRNWSHNLKKTDLIGNPLPDYGIFYFLE